MQFVVAIVLLLSALGSLAQAANSSQQAAISSQQAAGFSLPADGFDLQADGDSGWQEDCMRQGALLANGIGRWSPPAQAPVSQEPAGRNLSKAVDELAATAVVSEAPQPALDWTHSEVVHGRHLGCHPADFSGQLSSQTLQSRHVRMQI